MATLAKLAVELGLTDNMSGKLAAAGESLSKVGAKMTMGITLPAVAAGAAAVKMASDLNESMSKVDVVFGASATKVQAWATTTATSMGVSRNEALSAAGTFGNLLTNMGFTTDASADMSMQIVQLAADLGSFNNVPTDVALEAIRSGLIGETEPLRQFGVKLSQAAIEAEAMRLGLWNGTGELSNNAKAQASLSLIMAQTTAAQGDFTRTSEGAANQSKILRAQVMDTGAQLGATLLPMLIVVLNKLNELVGGFSGLSSEQQKYILIAVGVAAAIGPILSALGAIITIAPAVGTAFAIMTGPVGLIIAALAALFIAYQTNFLGFADGVNAAAAYVSKTFTDLQPTITNVANALSTAFTAALPVITEALTIITTALSGMIAGAVQVLSGFATSIKGIMQIIKGIFTGDWGLIKEGVVNLITGLKDIAMGIFNSWKAAIGGILGLLYLEFVTIWGAIKGYVTDAVSGAASAVIDLLTTLKDDALNAAFSAGYAIGEGIISGVNAIWDAVTGFVGGLVDDVLDKLSNVPGFSPIEHVGQYYGAKLGQGFADGINSASRSVSAAAGGLTGSAAAGMATNYNGGINISVSGAGDPNAVANAVFAVFSRELALQRGA